ncbi:MAG: TonB-dependent receptor [Melioribacteraceae bacterium]|nr:TonB-dependent receptor [Melioribacteraceae bacterium]MCF8263232.1 TonB-dependent receptor [Melioribacteraceae bacterium]MCF8412206.1 TonB-dependent receptor [Melioribacteraceae bacterium]MCF8431020.1 TonB-dependent receptor [Melioribacteraceae bacterium]
MKATLFILLFLLSLSLNAQNTISGIVLGENENGEATPLAGANIIWLGTALGTGSDLNGKFELRRSPESNHLVVSFIGYVTDTILVKNNSELSITLLSAQNQLDDISVVGKKMSSFQNFARVDNTFVLTQDELQKAACCSLAESFETNASVDVSFTDAITGVQQIEMLGLSGIYTQTTMEALPFIRGLYSKKGFAFVPGTWIKAINVSKGIGSVSNGYESITGQIDIDLKKPFDNLAANNGLVNIYANQDQRFEANVDYRFDVSKDIHAVTLLHGSSMNYEFDGNGDSFMDMPTFEAFNLMQRFQYVDTDGLVAHLDLQFVNDEKRGGMLNGGNPNLNRYGFNSLSQLFKISAKTGYVFQDDVGKSIGFQLSYSGYNNEALYGLRNYLGDQITLFMNLLYQTNLFNENNSIRAGASFNYDEFDESFTNLQFTRTERVPGVYLEYTYKQGEEFSSVIGLRYDSHNYYGNLFTPRIHLRYSPTIDWVFRAAAGKGFRTSNIFTEYASNFASSRNIVIERSNNFGYGLNQEEAWNFGISITHYFMYNWNDATLSIDFYRTQFDNMTIADLDSNPHTIQFLSVNNGSYSNSFQAELNFFPFENLSTRLAYRFIDARQKFNGEWKEKPFTSKHRTLINFGYSTEKENDHDSQMLYDLTIQWFGDKRIPSTELNPVGFRAREYSPDFAIVNAQVTRTFNGYFDLYLGVENLLGFKQDNPIIDPANPYGQFFDASLIWGPIKGRVVYSGLRWKL